MHSTAEATQSSGITEAVTETNDKTTATIAPTTTIAQSTQPTQSVTQKPTQETEKASERVNSSNSSSAPSNSRNENSSSSPKASTDSSQAKSGSLGSSSYTYRPAESTQNSPSSVTSVTLNKSSLVLSVGDSYTLTATVYPSNAVNTSLTWTSSNNAVLSVSAGKITARAGGTATVTAKSTNGVKASCTVQVKAVESSKKPEQSLSNIYITPLAKTISVGETVTVTLTGISECEWEISNPFVVSKVNSDSCSVTVKGNKAGVTNVTAVLPDGTSYKAKITVS